MPLSGLWNCRVDLRDASLAIVLASGSLITVASAQINKIRGRGALVCTRPPDSRFIAALSAGTKIPSSVLCEFDKYENKSIVLKPSSSSCMLLILLRLPSSKHIP
jgi:hypothetical protein